MKKISYIIIFIFIFLSFSVSAEMSYKQVISSAFTDSTTSSLGCLESPPNALSVCQAQQSNLQSIAQAYRGDTNRYTNCTSIGTGSTSCVIKCTNYSDLPRDKTIGSISIQEDGVCEPQAKCDSPKHGWQKVNRPKSLPLGQNGVLNDNGNAVMCITEPNGDVCKYTHDYHSPSNSPIVFAVSLPAPSVNSTSTSSFRSLSGGNTECSAEQVQASGGVGGATSGDMSPADISKAESMNFEVTLQANPEGGEQAVIKYAMTNGRNAKQLISTTADSTKTTTHSEYADGTDQGEDLYIKEVAELDQPNEVTENTKLAEIVVTTENDSIKIETHTNPTPKTDETTVKQDQQDTTTKTTTTTTNGTTTSTTTTTSNNTTSTNVNKFFGGGNSNGTGSGTGTGDGNGDGDGTGTGTGTGTGDGNGEKLTCDGDSGIACEKTLSDLLKKNTANATTTGLCVTAPTCDSTKPYCAQLKQAWQLKCADYNATQSHIESIANNPFDGRDELAQELDLSAKIADITSLNITGSCPADKTVSLLGKNYTISSKPYCDFAQAIRPLILLIGFFMVTLVISRAF